MLIYLFFLVKTDSLESPYLFYRCVMEK